MRYLNKHAAREKELRRLEREADRLHGARGREPTMPLEHPVRNGWTKTYVLANGIDRRPDAPIYRSILAVVNRRVYSHDRSFVDRDTGQPIVLRPLVLSVHKVESHGWPAQHLRLFELGPWQIDDAPPGAAWRDAWSTGYKLVHTWWLREDVQPYLITRERTAWSDADSRLSEIEAYMTHTCGRDRLSRLRGSSHWWRRFDTTRAEHQSRHTLAEQLRETSSD